MWCRACKFANIVLSLVIAFVACVPYRGVHNGHALLVVMQGSSDIVDALPIPERARKAANICTDSRLSFPRTRESIATCTSELRKQVLVPLLLVVLVIVFLVLVALIACA